MYLVFPTGMPEINIGVINVTCLRVDGWNGLETDAEIPLEINRMVVQEDHANCQAE